MNVLSEIKASFFSNPIPQIAKFIDYWIGNGISITNEPTLRLSNGCRRYSINNMNEFFNGSNDSIRLLKEIIYKLTSLERMENFDKNYIHYIKTIEWVLDHKTDVVEPIKVETINDLFNIIGVFYKEEL